MSDTGDAELEKLQGVSILLAEDNVTNQLVASQMLESLGAVVDIASDGQIALDRLRDRSYDVLLIDIEMPRVSGLDVIRAIRSHRGEISSAPVIALTAYAMQEHREKIMRVGADGLISKPITSIRQFGLDILAHMDGKTAQEAEPAAGEPAGAVIEKTVFQRLVSSVGPGATDALFSRISDDLADVSSGISEAAENGEAERMMSASHILSSVAGSVGALRLKKQADQLQSLADREELTAMSALAKEALPELERVREFIATERRGRAG